MDEKTFQKSKDKIKELCLKLFQSEFPSSNEPFFRDEKAMEEIQQYLTKYSQAKQVLNIFVRTYKELNNDFDELEFYNKYFDYLVNWFKVDDFLEFKQITDEEKKFQYIKKLYIKEVSDLSDILHCEVYRIDYDDITDEEKETIPDKLDKIRDILRTL